MILASENQSPVPPSKRLRMRLIFAIPITVLLFSLASGFFGFFQAERMLHSGPEEKIEIFSKILSVGVIAFLGGLLLAYGVTKPLKKITQKGVRILSSSERPSPGGNEISDLTEVFNKISFDLNKFIQDHQILENLKEGLITLHPSGAILSGNRVAENFFGPDLPNRSFGEILPLCPENRSFLDRVGKALRGEDFAHFRQEKIRGPDGQILALWISLALLEEPKGLLISFKNLDELRSIRSQIKRTETLAEMGGLTTALSHEIKNPLGAIRGLVEFLQQDMPADDPRRTFADRALQEVDRLTHLTENYLDLTRLERLDRRSNVNLNQILLQALILARQQFADKRIIVQENYGDLPGVEADPERLIQAFLNLLMNAYEATPEGGSLSISSLPHSSGISIDIRNSGSYLSPLEKEQIFRPFFTTKPKGTGFGLFLTQRIISAHGGRIEVESGPNLGTTFRIDLPRNISDGELGMGNGE